MANQDSGYPASSVAYPAPVAGGQPAQAMVAAGPYAPPAAAGDSFFSRGPEILHSGFDQSWLFHCLRRRWLMALLMGLFIGGLSAGMLLWLFPESSMIVSLLEVKSKPPKVFDDDQRLTPKDYEIFQNSQLALLKSYFVLHAALDKPEISQLDAVVKEEPDPVQWLIEELKVSFPNEGEILQVRFDGEENPEEMKKIVDSVIEAYNNNVVKERRVESEATRVRLSKLHKSVYEALQEKFKEYQELAESLGGGEAGSAEADVKILITELSFISKQISEAEKELVEIEVGKTLAIQEARSISSQDARVHEELALDPLMQQYQEELFMIEAQIHQLEALSQRGNSPQLKRLRVGRQQSMHALERYKIEKTRDIRERLKGIPNQYLSSVMAAYVLRKQNLDENISELLLEQEEKKEQIKQRSAVSPQLQMQFADIEKQQEVEREIAIKLQSWDVEADSEQKRITVMQYATASEKINKVQRYAIASVGGLAALCLTCYGIAMLEFGKRRLSTPEQVDEGLGIRVLGSLPPISSRKAMAPGSAAAAQLSESIDNVRATLMYDSSSRPRQVIMVTSPVTMEGSTTVASQLALSFTRAGRRTLLIDGDVREPSLHKLFGLPLTDGLCEVLRSELDVADAVRATSTEGLWLLTAGACDMDAVHMLATDQPQPIFEKLREEFDFIIIDGAPVLGLSDTISLSQLTDGAILTVLRDHSEIRKVYQAAELLKGLGIRLIGTVVNGVPLKADRRVARLHRAAAKQPQIPADESS